ncbi:MAG: glycoside hydrolase family 3 C-terminal domain-containing protein [Pseudomonadales bacterium]|nr:glycoside hydrolase family 3 C-terminal domain-containing protein [Pseudomonadales bacterium]
MNPDAPAPGLKSRHNQAAALVAQMTLDEKAAFCSGRSFWFLESLERLNLPAVMVTDGSHGLRKQERSVDHVGLNVSVPATCFPTASALASSWDVELLHEIGVALGEQCVAERVAVLLGPGMNIKRHPLCGRNFEYFSEDPLLTGRLAAAMVQGVQSQGVGTSIKHYAVNNQESSRMFVDAIVDERTLREIYLRGFEIAVREAQPWTVMCAYNRVNGTYCGEHDWLLNQVLRQSWGFEGLVVSDWGAVNDRVAGVRTGLDLEMPASGGANDRRVAQAVRDGVLKESALDVCVTRNVSLTLLGAELEQRDPAVDHAAHHRLARRAAGECVVLLKNSDGLLPVEPAGKIAVLGAFAEHPRYQGAGSSQVQPTRLDNALEEIRALVGERGEVRYAPGYEPKKSGDDAALIREAADAARGADVALVFAGLPGIYESEGFDRAHLNLPGQHNRLIEAVCAANPNTVVVLSNGAPVAMPWVNAPKAIVEGYLGGQAGGGAIADVVFGVVNPSGKLAETFPLACADVPADAWFPGQDRQVQYREGLYVGYRYFNSFDVPVLFPFGHGLSYTRFDYAALALSSSRVQADDGLAVSVTISNQGTCAGAEIVQLYVSDPQSAAYRPEQELRDFVKVRLEPGEVKTLKFRLDHRAFAVFDPGSGDWVVESGELEIRVGASSRDIRLAAGVRVESAQTPSARLTRVGGPTFESGKLTVSDAAFAGMLGRPLPAPENVRPFHMNSSVSELSTTWIGRRIRSRIIEGFQKSMGGGSSDETLAKMFEAMANEMPLRALPLFSGGKVSVTSVELLLAMLNGRWLSAFGKWRQVQREKAAGVR